MSRDRIMNVGGQESKLPIKGAKGAVRDSTLGGGMKKKPPGGGGGSGAPGYEGSYGGSTGKMGTSSGTTGGSKKY